MNQIISTANEYQSKTLARSEQSATSAIVKGIEKELGVDLDVSSDAELYSILRKNGAEPLSELLKMAYGAEKENKETEK